jgi:hypothetical protein
LLFSIGLACVSIPILIHLLKRRRRVVSWGAMRFLEEAYRKRRRIITLEQLILLSLRCLLIALIAMGVGSLILGSGLSDRQPRTLVLVIDDSIGSARQVNGASVLDASKRAAIEQLEALDPMRGDRVALISAAKPARAIVLPASDDFAAVLPLIEQLEPSDAGFDASGIATLLQQVDAGEERVTRKVLMISSDGRSIDHAMSAIEDELIRASFDEMRLPSPESSPATNVGIVSATPARALVVRDGLSLPQSVRVELIRSGDAAEAMASEIQLLDGDGQAHGRAVHVWSNGQREASVTVPLDTGGLNPGGSGSAVLRAHLGADDNPRDNDSFFTVPVHNSLRVAIVDRPSSNALGTAGDIPASRWVRAALAPRQGAGVQITSVDASQAASRLVARVDAVFVLAPGALSPDAWDRLARLHEQGVMLVITPDAQSESLAWFEQLRALSDGSFDGIEQVIEHEPPALIEDEIDEGSLLAGIAGELPDLRGSVSISRSLRIPSNANPVAVLSDGSPLGVQIPLKNGAGLLVVLAVPIDLEWSNLPARPLFVAMMQEILRQGVGQGESLPPVIAGNKPADPAWVESTSPLSQAASRRQQDDLHEETQIAGVLALRDAEGATRALRVIQPDAMSASADPVEQDAVGEQYARLADAERVTWIGSEQTDREAAETISSDDARSLALWMLWCALGVALVEFVLARLFTARLIASERAMGSAGRGARA